MDIAHCRGVFFRRRDIHCSSMKNSSFAVFLANFEALRLKPFKFFIAAAVVKKTVL